MAVEVNNFNAVRIRLASPDQIRSWSRGEVRKPETINYRTLNPERDGLFCERIFGPTKDWECSCGKYKRIRYRGVVCDKCGVEVTRAKVRRERMGHITLASPVTHIWFVRGTPSRIGLLLDVTPRVLEQVLYFAKYIVSEINDQARQREIDQVHAEVEGRVERARRAAADREQELQGIRDEKLKEIQSHLDQRLSELNATKEVEVNRVTEAGQFIDELLSSVIGQVTPEAIVFEPTGATVVPVNALVEAGHQVELRQTLAKEIERIEAEAEAQASRWRTSTDDEIEQVHAAVDEVMVSERAKVVKEEKDAKDLGDLRIKRIESIKLLQTLSETEYRELQRECGRTFKAGMGAEAVRDLLRHIDLDALATFLRGEMHSSSGQRRKKATKRLRIVEAFRKSGNRPEWMVMVVLPVLPPDLRPMVQLDGGRFATSDLNDLYRRVINRNNRLKRLEELGAPEIIVRNEKRMLQEAVDSLIDNGRHGRAVSGSSNHKLKSLSDMLKGKQGRFRQNLLGKRVDYSGRSVIVVGPSLRLHQCGLPKRMALELFKPFVMQRLVERGVVHNIKSAKRVVERVRPEVWDVLEEVIQDHPVLLNRAPTLHRLGIQAFQPVLIEGSAIQIHPLVCAAFNADFDGDQMAVHVPLSAAAKDEARDLMLSVRNLVQPSNGEPVTAPTLDMVLGCYYLTMVKPGAMGEGRAFASFDDARLAYELGQIALAAEISARSPDLDGTTRRVTTSAGRIIFNDAVSRVLEAAGAEPIGFQNQTMDKGALKSLVGRLIRRCGNRITAGVLDEIKTIGFHYATVSGITIAVGDITVPEQKGPILSAAEQEVSQVERDYRRGLITDEERYEAVVQVWSQAKEEMTRAVGAALDPFASVHMMAQSGAKGNVQQITQMSGMRGLMADPSGRIIELPIKSSFRDGLSVLEYFLSTHGARKGLADTAIKTSDSGYLTRRLIDVAQSIIVFEEDCGTELGIWIEDVGDPERRQIRLDQLPGRVPAAPIIDPDTGEIVVDRNQVMDEDLQERIGLASGITKIYLRSPLTCESHYGVCQMCYGWHMGTRSLARIGDAVGIVAAQSIGEPGTQLTMRTFHTGGVAGLDITSGLPRVEELFEARQPKGKALLSEIDGVAELSRTEESRVIRVVSRETYRDDHVLADGYELVVEDGGWVNAGEPLATAEDQPAVVAQLSGTVEVREVKEGRKTTTQVGVVAEERDEREYKVPPQARLHVEDGQIVTGGEQLTEGARDPQEILSIQGRDAVQRYLVEEVQAVYRGQGVTINDKHIEVIVRQMLRKLRVDEPGDTSLLRDELVDRFEYEETNREVLAEGGEPATARPVLLGVTKASLSTESFLAAASFQETTRVLTDAALMGKVDHLMGLKENVIIGKLIPAGSGLTARLEARRQRQLASDAVAAFLDSPIAVPEAAFVAGAEPTGDPGETSDEDEMSGDTSDRS
ncbi:MAG: DNA-directed RNA polymerase subunit beta' [Chloroflexi bacterium]|nr:DNA-directed RNA polymerase subunit beta' [Chloroflexota bacterium]